VVQGLAKGDAGELAVTQLTEVGVDEVLPWQAGRSVVRWDGPRGQKAVGRWTSAAREATKQARRSWLPVIGPVATTVDVVARLRAAAVGLVLHEGAEAPLAWAPLPAVGEVVVVVGPEGGVDPAELDSFLAAGAQAVRLGRTVLRSSTAGTAALSVLAARVGRWG
jgi:16S rRNA (uracil1498-N3)-methyltransferase